MTDPLLEEMELLAKRMGSKPKKKHRYSEPDDGEDDPPGGLLAEKLRKDIEKVSIENATKKRKLVEKDLVIRILNDIGHAFQTAVVDFPRREAPIMAAMAKVPAAERDFEKHLSNRMRDVMRSVKAIIKQRVEDGTYE